MIKRFNPDFSLSISHELAYMRETTEGGYVAHGDYATLFSELEVVKGERDALERQLSMSEAKCKGYFSDAAAAPVRCDALAVENAAMTRERTELSAIGELIRTQDNRITDQPFFAVMAKREIVGSEDHDCDRICWVENQSGDYVEATETQYRRLEAIYQAKYEVRDGWDRYAMKEIDVFVTGCFTEQGCKDYINKNGHNLNKPFIYAFGSYRNDEYQTVRKFIMQIPETPATDAALAAIEARG
uniref:hypothetical protein n=1 Tax=Serratia liquefaciens TaxID=614 RepID=UPI0039AFF40D